MKKVYFSIIVIIAPLYCISQDFLIDTCFNVFTIKKSGSALFADDLKFWSRCNLSTPDLFTEMNPYIGFKQPINYMGVEIPYCNNSYVGIVVYDKDIKHNGPNYREYVSAKLNYKLLRDSTYCLTMAVSLADTSNYAADGLEAYFSNEKIKYPLLSNLPYTPQIKNIGGTIITQKKGWTRICSIYKAQGGEQYLTIGNFKDDVNTTVIHVNEKIKKSDYIADCAYYYIGMVSLKAISLESECDCGLNILNEDTAVQISQIQQEFVVNEAIILNNVYFNTDESEILPDSYPILDSLYAFLTNNTYRIEISGHTDSIGTEKRNLELSTARANAIKDYLVIKGIFPQRIIIYGFGSLKPVADNRTEEGRKMNRRVEIKIIE